MARPLIGVLCCNEVAERAVQVVASRFVEPLSDLSGANVLLVPAVAHATDANAMADLFDGLLLTGSRSHIAPARYGGTAAIDRTDLDRDEVALRLAGRMIERGQPVFGICRGLQEINVLFGGSLSGDRCGGRHHRAASADDYAAQFAHGHEVELTAGGRLAEATGARRLAVNSVHEQAVDRLGHGLTVEALSVGDGVVEAVAAKPCGGEVLAVQWHPEWNVAHCAASQTFFRMIGAALCGVDTRVHRRTAGSIRGH